MVRTKLSLEQKTKIKHLYEGGVTVAALCSRYGVERTQLYQSLHEMRAKVKRTGANEAAFYTREY